MDITELEKTIVEHVNRPNYRPVKPSKLTKQLGLPPDQAKHIRIIVKKLVKRGELLYGEKHLIIPVSDQPADKSDSAIAAQKESQSSENEALAIEEKGNTESKPKKTSDEKTSSHKQSKKHKKVPANRVTGVFRRVGGGFGFVRPAGIKTIPGDNVDIFIPKKFCGDAASGDSVLVRLRTKSKESRRPNPEGEIVEILERESSDFVGSYFEAAGAGYVSIDGSIFQRAIFVGDPGAKNAKVNDKVVIQMVRYPSHQHDGEGVIIEVLGPRGEPGIDTLSIIREFGLPGEFPEDVMQSAKEQAKAFDENDISDRLDLTKETIITIDPKDARDFDDAISLSRLENGHWRLGVHIADVAHFVVPKTPVDREAKARATSVYLPDRVIPMLPEIISNNLASLQPDRNRYARTAFIEFTAEGVFVAADHHTTVICSKRRFTYEEVDDYLESPKKWEKKLTPEVHSLLGRMHELAMILRKRRFKRGALELSMQEVKIDLDDQGQVSGAHCVQNTESHQIIEEFMLIANEAVATIIADAEQPFIHRIHESPDPRKLKTLTEFVKELGFETESLESRFALQSLLDEVVGKPEQHAVNYAVLRSFQRAIYSPVEEGHFALASDCYCHFTSPIRRYPDLTIHRLLDALQHKKRPKDNLDQLFSLAEHCSSLEQRAESAERELTKVKLLTYMSGQVGETLEGIITGVESFGMFVQGVEIPAEGLVHVSSLRDDYYRFDRASHSLVGNRAGNDFRLGDRVRVTVEEVDIDRRKLDFQMVGKLHRQYDDQGQLSGKSKPKPKNKEKKRKKDKAKKSKTTRKKRRK